jgi:hypothetical protein
MRTIPPLSSTVHGVHYTWIYQRNVSISIFQWWWELFPFSLALFMVFITYGYTDKMCLSVYSSSDELFPFFLTLFMMFITHGYIDEMCPSVYSSVDWNYSLFKVLIINAFFSQWNHRQNENSNALTINVLFYCWLFTLLLTESSTKWKTIDNIWRGFSKFSCKLKFSI